MDIYIYVPKSCNMQVMDSLFIVKSITSNFGGVHFVTPYTISLLINAYAKNDLIGL